MKTARAFTALLIAAGMFVPARAADAPAQGLIRNGDFSMRKEFHDRYAARKQLDSGGDWPSEWNFDQPDEAVTGEFFVPAEPVQGSRALGLRKTEGEPVLQATEGGIHLQAGKQYQLRVEYLTAGGSGNVRVEAPDSLRDKSETVDVALGDTGGNWKTIEVDLNPRGSDADYRVFLQCIGVGADRAIYFKSISLKSK